MKPNIALRIPIIIEAKVSKSFLTRMKCNTHKSSSLKKKLTSNSWKVISFCITVAVSGLVESALTTSISGDLEEDLAFSTFEPGKKSKQTESQRNELA